MGFQLFEVNNTIEETKARKPEHQQRARGDDEMRVGVTCYHDVP